MGSCCARGRLISPKRIYKAAGFAHGVLRAAALDRSIRGWIDAARCASRADSVRRGVAWRRRIFTRRTHLARLENRVRRGRTVGDHEASRQAFGAWEAHSIFRHIACLGQIISLTTNAAVRANCLLRAPARHAHVLAGGALRALAANRIYVAVSVRTARRLIVLTVRRRAHRAFRARARDGAVSVARDSMILRTSHDGRIIHVADISARVVAHGARQTEPILAAGAPAADIQSLATERAQLEIRTREASDCPVPNKLACPQFSSREWTRIVELKGQGHHQINWDNPGYPGLVTCGPERVSTGLTDRNRSNSDGVNILA